MEELELERERAGRGELAERIARHLPHDGRVEAGPGLICGRASWLMEVRPGRLVSAGAMSAARAQA